MGDFEEEIGVDDEGVNLGGEDGDDDREKERFGWDEREGDGGGDFE